MRVAKDNVDVRLEIPGAVIRQRTDFGDVSGFDKISGEYFTLSAGVDTTPLFKGLEGDLCQCPHWGFVLRGQLTTTDPKGARETVNANDLQGLQLHPGPGLPLGQLGRAQDIRRQDRPQRRQHRRRPA